MDALVNKRAVQLPKRVLERSEECGISGEYTLPEYCPDIAVVLKCFAAPHIQNRQWSGEQLLVDGSADIRVLYLDEDRRCVRSLEFSQPFSCSLRGNSFSEAPAVELQLSTKYLTCRAVSPRRIEVRGAVVVSAVAECAVSVDVLEPIEADSFFVRSDSVPLTLPGNMCEKVMTINESLEFDHALPSAEMLLGGECTAVIRDCKILAGKVIVKGSVHIHQLYTDKVDGGDTHSLSYTVPFSQIIDVQDARDGLPCKSSVQVLSNTERCVVGPDGENSILEVVVKLLLQVQVYHPSSVPLMLDAFHCRFPVEAKMEGMKILTFVDQRREDANSSMLLSLPAGQWADVLEAWVQPQDAQDACVNGKVKRKGRLLIGWIARDIDGEITYHESVEEYMLEFPIHSNHATLHPAVTDVRYHIRDGKLELLIQWSVCITEMQLEQRDIVSSLQLVEAAPYPKSNANMYLYYANGGESLWDIGRSCHTAPNEIARENNISDDRVEDACVLIVPVMQ